MLFVLGPGAFQWTRSLNILASVVSDSVGPHGLQPTRLLCPWDFPGESTGVDHFKNWEKAIVRQGPEHAKEGSGYLQYYVLGIEAVEGHALGTVEQDAEEQEGAEEGEHWHISNYLATEF